MDIFVYIYLPGQTEAVPAGIFEYDPDQSLGMFRYGNRYRQRKDAVPVDPIALPLGGNIKTCETNSGLYGAFRDASPDMWGRLVTAKALKVPPESLNEGEYLLHSSGLRVGNLDFRSSPKFPEPEHTVPTLRDIDELIDAASRIRNDQPVDQEILQLFLHGSSLGGARPKCVIQDQGSLWIAKFPDVQDRWNHARVEWATMLLAKKSGVNVPEMRIMSTEMGDVLLSGRFDRENAANGFSRHGYLSALSVLQLDERDRDRFSYLTLADAIRKHGIGDQNTLEQLFRRMAFNVFCRNTDDHPRNHGVLYKGRFADLSPAFDITPTPSRAGVGQDFFLSMSIGPQGRLANLENLQTGAPRFGLDSQKANDILLEIAERITEWKSLYSDCGISQKDSDLFRSTFDSRIAEEVQELGNQPNLRSS